MKLYNFTFKFLGGEITVRAFNNEQAEILAKPKQSKEVGIIQS